MDVMMIQVSKNQYSDALELLSEFLAKDPANYPVWLVVCGGAALQTHGIIQRATKDVDTATEKIATLLTHLHHENLTQRYQA